MSSLVLLVEDHPFVRTSMTAALSAAGLAVVAVGDAQEAAARLQQDPGLALLVTDIDLGTGNGWALGRAARAVRPDLPILYMSADAERDYPREGLSNTLFLSKPFGLGSVHAALVQFGLAAAIVASEAAVAA